MNEKDYETGTQVYCHIGKVAEELKETVETIRYWSDKFEGIINPDRNKKGDRRFSPEDKRVFKIIQNLVNEKGLTLDGAKKRIIENRDGEYNDAEVIARLTKIKELLLDVKNKI
jgi:DNA-binding transcriptional MerR regulator